MNLFYKILKERINNYYSLYIIFYTISANIPYFINRISCYQLEKNKFYRKLGYPLNLKNPRSFNEKIVWKKIYDRNPLLPVITDKVRVRYYIKEILGEKQATEILIPLLYVTDQPETIPFEKLPHNFIIKSNHASKRNIIIEDNHLDKKEIIKTCRRWLNSSYGLEKLEWANQSVKRKIIIEKLLMDGDGKIPKDFKFYMFHGKCRFACVDTYKTNRNTRFRTYFNDQWHFLPIKKLKIMQGPKIEKPKNYKAMLRLAEKLAKPFDHIRVDLYNLNGKIYFGELTSYEGSGTSKYEFRSVDFELGKYWKIEPEYWKNHKNKN